MYAMTGWRVGYCVAPPELADVLRKLQEPQVSCPSAISQKAAEAALARPAGRVDAMRDAYRERRDRAVETARRAGLGRSAPQGTFYMLVDVARGGPRRRWIHAPAARRGGVAVAPGEVFGPGGEGLVRISLAVEADVIEEGMARIAAGDRGLRGVHELDGRRSLVEYLAPAAGRARRVRPRARRDAEREPARRRARGGRARARQLRELGMTRVETAGSAAERPNLLAAVGGLRRPHADPLRPPRHEAAGRSRRVANRPVGRPSRTASCTASAPAT